jgi:hypothetical protein
VFGYTAGAVPGPGNPLWREQARVGGESAGGRRGVFSSGRPAKDDLTASAGMAQLRLLPQAVEVDPRAKPCQDRQARSHRDC